MNKKNYICELLIKKELSFDELHKLFNSQEKISKRDLDHLLRDLVHDRKIYFKRRDNKYYLKKSQEEFEGIFRETRHDFAFVESEEAAVFIPAKFKLNAINGDTVKVLLFEKDKRSAEKENNKRTGKVVRIVKRNGNNIILRKKKDKEGNTVFIPDDFETKYKYKILGDHNIEYDEILITRFKKIEDKDVYVTLKEILGTEKDSSIDYLLLAYKENISLNFLDTSDLEAQQFQNEDFSKLTNYKKITELVFTIDGKNSKDLDDAISIRLDQKGNYYLSVHIADVSHYVKEKSSLDYDAFKRCNSIYLIDKVFPMLPQSLSNDLCSLNPDQARLTLTCEMKLTSAGEIESYRIYESIIKSDFRLTYDDVDQFLADKSEKFKNSEELSKALIISDQLATLLRKRKLEAGMIDFNLPELLIDLDPNGEPIKIWKKYQTKSEQIIEDFMVAANRCVAHFLTKNKIPGIFRIHENPKSENIEKFVNLLSSISLRFNVPISKITSKDFMDFLTLHKETDYDLIIKKNMVQTMEKAQYSESDLGHYALAIDHYLHFTSPIRRYADLVVHRYLKKYLNNRNSFLQVSEVEINKIKSVALQCSKSERASMLIEWKLKDLKKVRYMKGQEGQIYQGEIVSFTKYGIFIELSNLIQGMVYVDSLKNDEYYYDENKFKFIGKNTKKEYKLGQALKVKVLKLNLVQGFIDLELLE